MVRRRRRNPKDAEREILGAAVTLLRDRHRHPVTVATLMAGTSLGRSAFYAYFRDIPDLLRRLLRDVEGELSAASAGWFDGDGDPIDDLVRSADGIAGIHLRHGPVLRAVREVARGDPELAAEYRRIVIEGFVTAVTQRIGREWAQGHLPHPPHPAGVDALMVMTDTYLRETLGRHPRDHPSKVVETLTIVWSAALYGRWPAGPGGPIPETETETETETENADCP